MECPPLRLTRRSDTAAADGFPVLALDLALQRLARLNQTSPESSSSAPSVD